MRKFEGGTTMNEQHSMAQTSARVVEALKAGRAQDAETLCRQMLVEEPSSPPFLRLLSHALMKQSRLSEAEDQLFFALKIAPDFPPLHEDIGSVLAMQDRFEEALPFLEKAVRLDPSKPLTHKKLGQVLAALGRGKEADQTFQDFFDKDPDREQAAVGLEHIRAGRLDEAEKTFKQALRKSPKNVDAMRLLAVLYKQQDKKLSDAEALLRRAVEIAPDFTAAWLNLGGILQENMRPADAIGCYQSILNYDAENTDAHAGLASAYAASGDPDKALATYEAIMSSKGNIAGIQMGYGHVLKTTGNQPGALRAYREAVRLKPEFGEVYWSMANLKIFQFEDEEVRSMEAQLKNPDLSDPAHIHIRFALGKAYEDQKDYANAWEHYDAGNQKQRRLVSHDPLEMEQMHQQLIDVFGEDFLQAHGGNGNEAPDPIFIVGLPRSGSTLVEQILASHSQVEGTSELPHLGRIAASIGKYRIDGIHYPRAAQDLRAVDWTAYGKEYLDAAANHRMTDRAFFTDKLPNNFAHLGLLHMILPNAKIINARRHPLDSCLGGYKQLFAKGQNFTYDMFELGEYYREYDKLMKHWHSVMPGKILDVHYEDTVLDLEGQVGRILEHCGLPFEEACVQFHETKRAVQTASSEQVRQPIYKGGLGKWRCYEDQLSLWKDALAPVIEALPAHIQNAGR